MKFWKACKEQGLKPIYGSEQYIVDSLPKMFETKQMRKNHITVLAKNVTGYKNLLKIASLAYSEGFYYRPTIDKQILFNNREGLVVLSGCWTGFVQEHLKNKDLDGAMKIVSEFKDVFGEDYFLETQHFPLFKDTIDLLNVISEKFKIPMVLTCDPHYLKDDQAYVQEILHAIRDRRTFDESQIMYGAFQWPADMLFEAVSILSKNIRWQELFENTCSVAERCNNVEMQMGGVPRYPIKHGEDPYKLLLGLCKEGVIRRGLDQLQGQEKLDYNAQIQKELKLVKEKDFVDYFLIVADIINWAKKSGILVGPSRGSSGGSLLCYLTGITEINPLKHGLLFERFLDESRFDLPDIDIDFEDERRDEVKEYISKRYGDDRVCSVGTFAQFKGRNSLDEIGKVYKIPPGEVSTVKKFLVERSGADMRIDLTINDTFEMSPQAAAVREAYPKIEDAIALEGQLRHMSMHAAGVIVGDRPLQDVMAIYEKDSAKVSSIAMEDASALGLVKIDILGITELSIIAKICGQIGWNVRDVYKIPLDDKVTLEGFKAIDVEGVFQFEGDSTKSVLRQLPKLDFEALTACVTMSKPGPAHSGSTGNFISSARGEKVKGLDWHPVLRAATEDTHFQIIYQEQVLKIVREIGKMTWTDANKIRQFMAHSEGEQAFEGYWPAFQRGALENGLNEKQARDVWDMIKTMGRWGFNKSHAVAYAIVAFWSMYFKRHYPVQFYWARLVREKEENKRYRLLLEINKRKIKILPPTVGKSDGNWKIENENSLRAGFTGLKGVGDKTALKIIESNASSLEELKSKKIKGISKRHIEALEAAEKSIDFFGLNKFDVLDKISPMRQKLEDLLDHSQQYNIEVAGIFVEMNYKDIHEEARSRGKSTANTKNPEISKYAMLLLEDETDRCLMNIDRYLFNKIGEKVWEAFHNGNFVVIKGIKVSGWRIVRAREMFVYDSDGKKIS